MSTEGKPAARELRVEVIVYERKRRATVPGEPDAPWSTFRERNRIVVNEAAVQWQRTHGDQGDAVNVHAAGKAEDTLEEVEPQGRPS